MSYHRLLERRAIEGRMRESGSLIDYRGPPVAHLEPLEVRQHSAWIGAMLQQGYFPDEHRAAA